jgi:hypothetical protein
MGDVPSFWGQDAVTSSIHDAGCKIMFFNPFNPSIPRRLIAYGRRAARSGRTGFGIAAESSTSGLLKNWIPDSF